MGKNAGQFYVYWANLDLTIGREIKKTRPCIVVSPQIMNDTLDTVIVVPLTSTIIDWPFRMTVKVDGKISSAACDQIRTISKGRLCSKIGKISGFESEKLLGIIQAVFSE